MPSMLKILPKTPDYEDYPYKETDKGIDYINRRIVRGFGMLDLDELNRLGNDYLTITRVKDLYKELDKVNRQTYRRIYYADYRKAYKEVNKRLPRDEEIDYQFLEEMYESYDPITGYVYDAELDRKASRTAENIIARDYVITTKYTAMKYWARQSDQYAVESSDRARYKAYRSSGVEYFKWIAEYDEKTCDTCLEYHEEVFRYDMIPDKPHYNCRCYIVPVL